MLNIKTSLAAAMFAMLILGNAIAAEDYHITVLAEDAPPHSMLKDGQVTGTSTEFVRLLAARAGLIPDIRLMNWKAALQIVDGQSAVLIYPIARTAERENGFYWIGRIAVYKTYFYKKKDREDIQLKKLEDARVYRIGAVRKDVRADFLLSNGFPASAGNGLIDVTDNKEALRLLHIGRVDLTPLSPFALEGACSATGLNCSQFEAALPINLTADMFVAASKKTPAETVKRLQAAYDSLVADGTFARMLGKYSQQ
ncbi:MAG: transporter substrate-binding domain-containing protein [Pseudomonadota bacterium]